MTSLWFPNTRKVTSCTFSTACRTKEGWVEFLWGRHTENYLISRVSYSISFAETPESRHSRMSGMIQALPCLTPGRGWGGDRLDHPNFPSAPTLWNRNQSYRLTVWLSFVYSHPVPGKEVLQRGWPDAPWRLLTGISRSGKAFLRVPSHISKTEAIHRSFNTEDDADTFLSWPLGDSLRHSPQCLLSILSLGLSSELYII